jgi:hypothetical protein
LAISGTGRPGTLTLELDGSHNLYRHYRLQDHWAGLVERLLECAEGCETESKLGRILDVSSSVL